MKNVGAQILLFFTSYKLSSPIAIEKIKILGAVLELPAKQQCQSYPFTSKMVKFAGLAMVLNGSFKRTPGKILNPAFAGNFCRMPSLVSKYFKLDIPFLVVYLLIWLFVMKRTNHRTLKLHFGLWAEEISKEEKKNQAK